MRIGDQMTFIMDPAWLLIEYFTWIYGIDITIGQAQSNGRSPCIHHGAGMWCLHNLLKRQEFLKCHQSCVFSRGTSDEVEINLVQGSSNPDRA